METLINTAVNTYPVRTGSGLLDNLSAYLPEKLRNRKKLVVTDDNVSKFYLNKVMDGLENATYIVVEHGENSKSFPSAVKIAEKCAVLGFTRKDCIIALGGGVIGDLAGFVASIYMRGIPYVQLPTTLLAGIDSSVGGKTAINLEFGKNLLGRIYPPESVIFDLRTLTTLPKKFVTDGIGEGLKYALLAGGEVFSLMENGLDENNCESFVDMCILYKKYVVETDENENSLRRLLNLGHTVGHAVERRSGLDLTHGVCVAIGLRVIVEVSFKRGFLAAEEYEKISRLLNKYDVPVNPYPIKELIDSIKIDKKSESDFVNLITVHGIGDCRITKVAFESLEEFLQ